MGRFVQAGLPIPHIFSNARKILLQQPGIFLIRDSEIANLMVLNSLPRIAKQTAIHFDVYVIRKSVAQLCPNMAYSFLVIRNAQSPPEGGSNG